MCNTHTEIQEPNILTHTAKVIRFTNMETTCMHDDDRRELRHSSLICSRALYMNGRFIVAIVSETESE